MIDYLYDVAISGGPLVLVVAAAILVVESGSMVGLVLPGSTIVLLVGVVTALWDFPLVAAIGILTAATLTGSQIAFLRARRTRPTTSETSSTRGVQAWVKKQFERDPVTGTSLARLFGGARTLGPRLAAASTMSHKSFAVTDALTALLWVTALTLTGRLAGQNPSALLLLAGCGLLLLVGIRGVRKLRRNDPNEAPHR